MSFFDKCRVIMREFLEDDGLINLSRYDNSVADDLDAGDAPELEGEDR